MDTIVKILFCGDVDSGKSTLVGQILTRTDNVKEDQMEDARKASEKYSDKFEYAMLLDGLKDERQQNITIDVAHRYMNYKNYRFHILDCPGHVQYTKNMAVAAAQAEMAIIVIDAIKQKITQQTLTHINICKMFNIKNIIFVINKMDSVGWAEDIFNGLKNELTKYSNYVVPVSALVGTNIFSLSKDVFYRDKTIFEYIDYFIKNRKHNNTTFLAHIISTTKHNDKRYYYSYLDCNKNISVPKTVVVCPSNIITDITVESYDGFNLVFSTKEDVGISRGDCIIEYGKTFDVAYSLKAEILFLENYNKEHILLLKNGTKTVTIKDISNDNITLFEPLVLLKDNNKNNLAIIIDYITKKTIAVALIKSVENNSSKKGTIYWLTGLSGSGKTTIAKEIVKQSKIRPILLDADELRNSLSKDLKYDNNSRLENNRRISELAIFLAMQGIDVVVACISPFKSVRDNLKLRYGDKFKEIYVNTPLEICKKRDPKGLYNTSKTMVGVDSVYEIPENPYYVADTVNKSAYEIAKEILNL